MPTYTLHTYPGNFRAFKILVAAQYNGVDVAVPDFDAAAAAGADFLAKNPLGKVPVLETEKGCIFESNAIARFIARIRADTELYGSSFFESAQIDSWVDFASHEIELPASMWFYPVFGYMPFNGAATAKAKEDLKKALAVLEKHLEAELDVTLDGCGGGRYAALSRMRLRGDSDLQEGPWSGGGRSRRRGGAGPRRPAQASWPGKETRPARLLQPLVAEEREGQSSRLPRGSLEGAGRAWTGGAHGSSRASQRR